MKKKPNPKPTADDLCKICGKPYAETHEVYFGNPNAALSQKYGMTIRLCPYHHRNSPNGVHHNKEFRDKMQMEYQEKFEQEYPGLSFIEIFGRNYL